MPWDSLSGLDGPVSVLVGLGSLGPSLSLSVPSSSHLLFWPGHWIVTFLMTVTRYLSKAVCGRKVWCRLRVWQERQGSRNVRCMWSQCRQSRRRAGWVLGLTWPFLSFCLLSNSGFCCKVWWCSHSGWSLILSQTPLEWALLICPELGLWDFLNPVKLT